MWITILAGLLAGLLQADLAAFAVRVAEALEQSGAKGAVLRAENPQLSSALEDSFRRRRIILLKEPDESGYVVNAWMSARRGRPLAVARIASQGREVTAIFSEIRESAPADATAEDAPAIAVRTRTLLAPELPVLDIAADGQGNLFVLHPDRLRVYGRNGTSLELKAEWGLDTGAERLRDPLVRLVVRENPPQLEIHSTAASVAASPPLPIEGYAVKAFGAAPTLRIPHPSRAIFAALQPVEGRNYFRGAHVPEIQGIAPVMSPQRAFWIVLDGAGQLLLADAELRPTGATVNGFGGDVASVMLSCAGTVALAAGGDPQPQRDRISLWRVENDRFLPQAHLEVDGAVRRLVALPPAPEKRGAAAIVLAVASRLEEIELSCAP